MAAILCALLTSASSDAMVCLASAHCCAGVSALMRARGRHNPLYREQSIVSIAHNQFLTINCSQSIVLRLCRSIVLRVDTRINCITSRAYCTTHTCCKDFCAITLAYLETFSKFHYPILGPHVRCSGRAAAARARTDGGACGMSIYILTILRRSGGAKVCGRCGICSQVGGTCSLRVSHPPLQLTKAGAAKKCEQLQSTLIQKVMQIK